MIQVSVRWLIFAAMIRATYFQQLEALSLDTTPEPIFRNLS